MIQPFQRDAALLADIRSGTGDAGFRTWWLGQSGFLVQWGGHHLLLDPYLSDSLTRKYAQTAKPHVRMTELVIAPEKLDFLEVVTSSHNHTDHLDADTLQPLLTVNPALRMIIPEANREFVAGRTARDAAYPLGLNDGESLQCGVWNFTGVAAAHNELEKDDAGRHKYLALVIEFGPFRIFHSGDTLLYPGLSEKLLALGSYDLAFLPINGNIPERGVAGNMNGSEAAQLADEIHAGVVVPHHFEMFAFNTASPAEFERECARREQKFKVLRAGECLQVGEASA